MRKAIGEAPFGSGEPPVGPAQEAESAGPAIRSRRCSIYAANGSAVVSALALRTARRARSSWRSTVRSLVPRRAAVSR